MYAVPDELCVRLSPIGEGRRLSRAALSPAQPQSVFEKGIPARREA